MKRVLIACLGGLTLAVREFLELSASRNLSQKSWDSLAKRWLDHKNEQIDLWKKYQKKIRRSVSAYRAAQFLQVEAHLRVVGAISIEIAGEDSRTPRRPALAWPQGADWREASWTDTAVPCRLYFNVSTDTEWTLILDFADAGTQILGIGLDFYSTLALNTTVPTSQTLARAGRVGGTRPDAPPSTLPHGALSTSA